MNCTHKTKKGGTGMAKQSNLVGDSECQTGEEIPNSNCQLNFKTKIKKLLKNVNPIKSFSNKENYFLLEFEEQEEI